MDALDDDELDDISEEALETATKKGDEKLDNKSSQQKDDNPASKHDKKDKEEKKHDKGETSEDKSQGKQEAQKHEKNAKKSLGEDSQVGKMPKQGDERKNESVVPRSG